MGRRSFLTAQPCTGGTVSHRRPIWASTCWLAPRYDTARLTVPTFGGNGAETLPAGGGVTGRMHSKLQGFSTQPITQPGRQRVSTQLDSLCEETVYEASGRRCRQGRVHTSTSLVLHLAWVALRRWTRDNMPEICEHITSRSTGHIAHGGPGVKRRAGRTGRNGEHIVRGEVVSSGRGIQGITKPTNGTRGNSLLQ